MCAICIRIDFESSIKVKPLKYLQWEPAWSILAWITRLGFKLEYWSKVFCGHFSVHLLVFQYTHQTGDQLWSRLGEVTFQTIPKVWTQPTENTIFSCVVLAYYYPFQPGCRDTVPLKFINNSESLHPYFSSWLQYLQNTWEYHKCREIYTVIMWDIKT